MIKKGNDWNNVFSACNNDVRRLKLDYEKGDAYITTCKQLLEDYEENDDVISYLEDYEEDDIIIDDIYGNKRVINYYHIFE